MVILIFGFLFTFLTCLLYIWDAVDDRCGMELDETDPAVWLKLEAATDEYIQNTSVAFKNICQRLLERPHDEKFSDNFKSHQFLKSKNSKTGMC